jgi:ParB/RepB/Spo0J family partition protein
MKETHSMPEEQKSEVAGGNGSEVLTKEDPRKLRFSPFNVTGREPSAEFIDSIRSQGIIEPLIVRERADKTRELIAGERRCRAAIKIDLNAVPIIVRVAGDREVIELQTVENAHRQDLSPIQEAQKYQQLLDQYAKEKPPMVGEAAMKMLCEKVGRSKSAVYEALRLLELSQPVQAKVRTGALPISHAGLITKLPAELQAELAHLIAPGKRLSPQEERKLEQGSGYWIDERDPDTGLVSFRDAKEIVDSAIKELGQTKEYEAKAAVFRENGGVALTCIQARKERETLAAAEDYLTEFYAHVRDLTKDRKDLPQQVMRPHPQRPTDPQMVWLRSELIAALKKAGVKAKTSVGGGGGRSSKEYTRRERERQAKARQKKAILAEIIEPLRAAAGKRNAKIPWPLFFAGIGHWKAVEVCRRRGWKANWQNGAQVLRERVAKLPENQMAGIIGDLLIEEFTTEHTGTYKPELVDLASFYGIDAKAIAKSATTSRPKVQSSGTQAKKSKFKSGGGLTAVGRKRLSAMMKARWAARVRDTKKSSKTKAKTTKGKK